MVVYLDTSAILAILYDSDTNHLKAIDCWMQMVQEETGFVFNNYVFVEAFSLLQRRYGLEKAQTLEERIAPLVEIDWLDANQHEIALQGVLTANRRNLSLVDCSSFETMRRLGIRTVFTFDEHFREQGFDVIPN